MEFGCYNNNNNGKKVILDFTYSDRCFSPRGLVKVLIDVDNHNSPGVSGKSKNLKHPE
jgi:hypothetical protein